MHTQMKLQHRSTAPGQFTPLVRTLADTHTGTGLLWSLGMVWYGKVLAWGLMPPPGEFVVELLAWGGAGGGGVGKYKGGGGGCIVGGVEGVERSKAEAAEAADGPEARRRWRGGGGWAWRLAP